MNGSSIEGTPEYRLITAVLASWAQDASWHAKKLQNARDEQARAELDMKGRSWIQQIESRWTERLCLMVDIDYGRFKKAIVALIQGDDKAIHGYSISLVEARKRGAQLQDKLKKQEYRNGIS